MAPRSEIWDRDRDAYGPSRRERFDEQDSVYRESSRRRVYEPPVESRGPPRERSSYRFEDEAYVRRDGPDVLRRGFVEERERQRDYVRDPSPLRRPARLVRRQSSLDTFDRPPPVFYDREEYGPPARRTDYHDPYAPPPLPPQPKVLMSSRPRDSRQYDEVKITDTEYDEFHNPAPRRRRHRGRSPDSVTSRTVSRRSSSSTSSVSSRSSSRTRTSVRSEYPKKGRTRIPSRLVYKKVLVDLEYPFIEEGDTTIVLKALGQNQIDHVLRASESYRKREREIAILRSSAGSVVEERREERREEVYTAPAPIHVPAPAPHPTFVEPMPAPAPVVVNVSPGAEVEVVKHQVAFRDASPARTATSYFTSTGSATTGPSILESGPVYASGPLVRRHRSKSRTRRELRAEIRALESELRHSHSHSRGRHGELVRAERLSDGQLVLVEERVERVEEGHRGPRIERDKKGRMAISVPKYG